MKASIHLLSKPEYVFRPRQILRRLRWARIAQRDGFAETVLPWGVPMRFRADEVIGASLARMGIYDLGVSEAIWRLLDPGEDAIDVGANIGHMTGVMAARVGGAGTVLCFEPHPEVWEDLAANLRAWESLPHLGRVRAERVALSDRSGRACLGMPADFRQNRGTAALVTDKPAAGNGVTVDTRRLDDLIDDPQRRIGLMKIDVEGHELQVLEGGVELLRRKQIRDIVFEEHRRYPTPVTAFLEAHGYTLFWVAKGFFGPLVRPIADPPIHPTYDPPSCLATREPSRALARLTKKGWAVYGLGPFRR